jgi:hypothetical protein
MPWEKIHKVSIATMTVNMALDLENAKANEAGTRLEALTKDELNTGLMGQIRYRVSESNLYAFLFGIKKPFVWHWHLVRNVDRRSRNVRKIDRSVPCNR